MLNEGGDIKNCVIFNNSANNGGYGGGIFDGQGSSTTHIINCTIVSNEAKKAFGSAGIGGGIRTMTHTQIINCIVWGNSAEASDPDVYANGMPTIRYSDIKAYPTDIIIDGIGTTDADPLFVSFPPAQVEDLALQGASPVAGSGTDEAVVPTTDYTGASRTFPYSMGAFEKDD
jgi:hypothetical protein